MTLYRLIPSLKRLAGLSLLTPILAQAHEGHGIPGTLWHELQHQLWNFGGFVILGAVLLALCLRERKD
jgi:hypothetical protein